MGFGSFFAIRGREIFGVSYLATAREEKRLKSLEGEINLLSSKLHESLKSKVGAVWGSLFGHLDRLGMPGCNLFSSVVDFTHQLNIKKGELSTYKKELRKTCIQRWVIQKGLLFSSFALYAWNIGLFDALNHQDYSHGHQDPWVSCHAQRLPTFTVSIKKDDNGPQIIGALAKVLESLEQAGVSLERQKHSGCRFSVVAGYNAWLEPLLGTGPLTLENYKKVAQACRNLIKKVHPDHNPDVREATAVDRFVNQFCPIIKSDEGFEEKNR